MQIGHEQNSIEGAEKCSLRAGIFECTVRSPNTQICDRLSVLGAILRGSVDRGLQFCDDLVNLVFADDQRRCQNHRVANCAANEAVVEAVVSTVRSDRARVGKEFALSFVTHEFDSGEETHASYLPHDGMIQERLAQATLQVRPDFGLYARHESLALD